MQPLTVGTGRQNTVNILAGCDEPGIAARIAENFMLNGFNDWFLSSTDELMELEYVKFFVDGLATDIPYWSSTEILFGGGTEDYSYEANCRSFGDFQEFWSCHKGETYYVRAVQDF